MKLGPLGPAKAYLTVAGNVVRAEWDAPQPGFQEIVVPHDLAEAVAIDAAEYFRAGRTPDLEEIYGLIVDW